MSDLFDRGDVPVVRGRRDPEIQAALEAESTRALLDGDPIGDPGQEEVGQTYVGLDIGDSVVAKISIAVPTNLGEAWFTYGANTHVLPNEDEAGAFGRLADIVITRVLDLAENGTEAVNDLHGRRVSAAQEHRIQPRG